jgi:hypothetical protein
VEINEQKLRAILIEQREEFQRYVGAIAEEFTDRLAGVAEMVAQNTEDISVIKLDIEFIKSSLKQKGDVAEFSALERRVALLENRR